MLPGTQELQVDKVCVPEDEKGRHKPRITGSRSFLNILNSAFHPRNRQSHNQHSGLENPTFRNSLDLDCLQAVDGTTLDGLTFKDECMKDIQVPNKNCCKLGRFEISRFSQCSVNCPIDEHLNGANADQQRSPSRTRVTFMEDDYLSRPVSTPDSTLIRFNVSGTPFVVRRSTLQRDPYVFAKILEDVVWIPSTKEYYIERDAVVFRFIHNYLRCGEVHLPLGMCGPLVEKELDEWGIPLGLDIQRCCLGPVIDSKSKLESLQRFERKLDPKPENPVYWIKNYQWQAFRSIMWHILEAPSHLSPRKTLSLLSTIKHEDAQRKISASTVDTNGHTLTSQSTGCFVQIPLQTIAEETSSGTRRVFLSEMQHRSFTESYKPPTPRYIRWLRKGYLAYEIMIITLAVLVFMVSTVPEMQSNVNRNENGSNEVNKSVERTSYRIPSEWLVYADVSFSTAISLDVIARMIFCPDLCAWILSPSTLIDIISLIPFYFEIIFYGITYFGVQDVDHKVVDVVIQIRRYIVILKVFIVLRLFRILKRHRSTRVLLYTIRTTFAEVAIIVVLIIVSALFFGTAIYFTDDNFQDIPSGSWWALITMSTVGYGDMVPKHTFGYIVAMICIIIGTLLMSYNIPILVNHFLLYYDHSDQLYHVKQLHRNAKRKARRRRVTVGAEQALSTLKSYFTNNGSECFTVNSTTPSLQYMPSLCEDVERGIQRLQIN